MDLTPTLPFINIVGFLILGAAMIFTQWRLGGTRVSADVITAYKERVDQLISENAGLRKQIGDLQQSFAAMQATVNEKEKNVGQLTALLQGKDPNQIEYTNEVKSFLGVASEFIKRSDDRDEKIFKLLSKKK